MMHGPINIKKGTRIKKKTEKEGKKGMRRFNNNKKRK